MQKISLDEACEIAQNEFIKMNYKPWISWARRICEGWFFVGQSTDRGGAEYGNVPLKILDDGTITEYDIDENWEECINSAYVEVPTKYLRTNQEAT